MWLTVGGGVLAAAIVVWGVLQVARARTDAGPGASAAEVAADTPADTPMAAPREPRSYENVFSVSDAALHQGTWFVLDRLGSQVHRIDESGVLLGSFGRSGDGPGELRRPTHIAVHRDTVIVLEGGDLHLYDLDGNHLTDRRAAMGGCVNGGARGFLPRSTGLLLLVDCGEPGRSALSVVLDDGEGAPRTLMLRASDPGVVDVSMANGVLAPHPQGFVFGLAGDECLAVFSPRGEESGEVCHDWIDRLPIPEAVKEAMVPLRAQARGHGLRLVEPDLLPPFIRVFQVGEGLAYQVPLPEDLEAFRLVRRGASGEAVAFPLPVAQGMFASGNSVLLWWDGLEGMRISVRQLDGS